MTRHGGKIRLGVLDASPTQLTQIEAWAAEFRTISATIEAVDEIGPERHDLYLVVVEVEADSEVAKVIRSKVMQAAPTPFLVLATRDDERLLDAAVTAGAVDYAALPTLDAVQLERVLQFSLGRRRLLDELTAREACLAVARERDRQQLANTLHDGPMQDLIGVRFLLGALSAEDSAAELQSALQQVIQALRALCNELKPPALGPFGLEKAMRAYLQTFQARYPEIAVTIELDVDNQQLPEWARLALFRVLQAATSNVAQHAQASHLWVRLRLDEEQIRLTVADDGQGFGLPASWLDFARKERFGLLMMQERVDALRGRMVVQSTPGSGTRVMVHAPLRQPALPLPSLLAPLAPERAAPDRNG